MSLIITLTGTGGAQGVPAYRHTAATVLLAVGRKRSPGFAVAPVAAWSNSTMPSP